MLFQFWQKRAPAGGAIEGVVKRALYADPRLRDFDAPRIHVAVDRDEVSLTGAVSTSEARYLAGRVAEVPGVSRVRNELRTDADLTQALRAALAGYPGTADLARDSLVFHGVAELRGRATYNAQLLAKKMASAIDGVQDVAIQTVWASAP
jgi:osmotically-inducible protein OsmY